MPQDSGLVLICELCRPVARIVTTRAEAKNARNDHALDMHRAAMIAVPRRDRARWLHRMVRITNALGRPERITL